MMAIVDAIITTKRIVNTKVAIIANVIANDVKAGANVLVNSNINIIGKAYINAS